MATSQSLLKSSRLFHLYCGVFITPALLFFAFTGAIQTFSLHETTRGSSYKPPAILVELGQLHKKQTLVVPVRKGPPPDAKPESHPTEAADPKTAAASKPAFDPSHVGDHTNQQKHDRLARESSPTAVSPAPTPSVPALPAPTATPPAKTKNLLPMKIFFLIVSIGLFSSTLTGLYMSYKYARRSSYITLTLVAGIVVPLLLLLF